jgi:hypothetical protein
MGIPPLLRLAADIVMFSRYVNTQLEEMMASTEKLRVLLEFLLAERDRSAVHLY